MLCLKWPFYIYLWIHSTRGTTNSTHNRYANSGSSFRSLRASQQKLPTTWLSLEDPRVFQKTFWFNADQRNWIFGESLLVGPRGHLRKEDRLAVIAAIEEGNPGIETLRKRKVEHICLLKAKEDLSIEQEKDMLDYLYTTQYQMRGIVAISLGLISDQNPEQYTHAIFMSFQTKDDLTKFYQNPFYVGVLKEHVMPYCHGVIDLDYESEVEDDILPIFRKGEEFNYGVELILLVAFMSSSLGELAEDALTSSTKLTLEFPSLIVQATKGPSLDLSNTKYIHGVVIPFRSSEAFNMFINSSEYNNMWKSKFQPIIQKALYINFSVVPLGSELM